MAAILSNMKAALTGNMGGAAASPNDTLAALQTNPQVQAAVGPYMPAQLKQNLFLPEGGSPGFLGAHPHLSNTLENMVLGLGSMNEVPQTTGQSISMVANSLMAGPMAHRQYQMQQVMMPFQIAQQMGAITKQQAEAGLDTAKAKYFSDHGDYYNRGEGAGITNSTQNRTTNNVSAQLASDGKMYQPGDPNMPPDVKFIQKGNPAGPYGNSPLGKIIARIQGIDPTQSSELLTDQERQQSQSMALNALHQYNASLAGQAGARNTAPGGPVQRLQNEELYGTSKAIHTERITQATKELEDLRDPKKGITMAMQAGASDPAQYIQQRTQTLQQGIDAENRQFMKSSMQSDYTPYLSDVTKAVTSGKLNLDDYSPEKINPQSVIAPSMGTPTSPSSAPNSPQAGSLSPGAQNYMSNWK